MSLSEGTLLALLRLARENGFYHKEFDILCAQMRRQMMMDRPEKSDDAISFPDDADIRINGRRIYPAQYSGSWAQPAPKGMSGAEKIIYLTGWTWRKASETAPEATPPFGKEEAQARSDIKNSSRQTPAKETGTDGCDIRYPTQQSTKHQQTAAPQPQADLSFPQEGQAVLSISESLPDTSSSPSSDETHSTDSSSEGRDESVADGEFHSPTDADLQKYGCPELIERRAVQFLCSLRDVNLLEIVYGDIPASLKRTLSRLAMAEVERRRSA